MTCSAWYSTNGVCHLRSLKRVNLDDSKGPPIYELEACCAVRLVNRPNTRLKAKVVTEGDVPSPD